MTIISVNSISGINSITAQSGALNFYTAAGNNLPISAGTLNVGTGASISSPATNVLALGTNNTEVIRIASTGAVGVGTNDPGSTKMMVYGNGNVLRLGDFTNTHDLRFTGPNNWDLQLDTTNDKFNIRRNSSTFSTIDSNGKIGVGVTAPKGAIHLVDSTYKCLVLSNTNNNSTSTGGVIAGDRYTKTNNPFVAFASWDGAGTVRKAYVGGGGWNLPEATEIGLYTATTYDETSNAALERLKIDSAGRVTMPYQPIFFAKCSSSSYVTTSPIPFNSVDVNIGSGYNSSTYRFTAPIAGTYYFVSTTYINAGNTVNDGGYTRFRVNGTSYQYAYAGPGNSASPNGHITITLTKIITLSANDWVDVTFNIIGNGSYYAGGSETTFGGYLMG